MPRKSLKTKDVDPYDGLTLPELTQVVRVALAVANLNP